jgi:hypothetical protein
MAVTMYCLREEIGFTISGGTCQQILDWKQALDEAVFSAQVTTGSFRGRCPVDDDLRAIMLAAEAKGRIMPYYGVGGGSGAYTYTLRWTSDKVIVQVENEIVGESLEIVSDARVMDSRPMAYEEPWVIFRIDGKELKNLRQWRYWYENQANTSRYLYKFGQVAMGRLGYTVKVEDTKTSNIIDVTAYEDW